MEDQHDDALEKVLAALRTAPPPEGMQARIAQRLQQHATSASISAPRGLPDWWRGAIAGAATAMLATGLFFFAAHLLRSRAPSSFTARNRTPAFNAPGRTSVSNPQPNLCASPALLRAQYNSPGATTLRSDTTLRAGTLAENSAPSHPAPDLPLTVQERELVHLARTADPKLLAALNLDEEAKVEAENAAAFAKFFAHPAPPPNPDTSSDTTSKSTPDPNSATSDASPQPDPIETPAATDQNPAQPKEEQQ
jgi:hypothetical protein